MYKLLNYFYSKPYVIIEPYSGPSENFHLGLFEVSEKKHSYLKIPGNGHYRSQGQ